MIKLSKSSILAKVKVGSVLEKTSTKTEQNIYTAIILSVPLLIVGSVFFTFAKIA